jgi:hypothetical protein
LRRVYRGLLFSLHCRRFGVGRIARTLILRIVYA